MNDGKAPVQSLLCFALVLSLILPGVVAGASPVAGQVMAEYSIIQSEVGDTSRTSAGQTQTWNWYGLDDIRNNPRGHYVMVNDLDAATAGCDEPAGTEVTEEMIGYSHDHIRVDGCVDCLPFLEEPPHVAPTLPPVHQDLTIDSTGGGSIISSVSAQAGPDPYPAEMGAYFTWPAKESGPARLEAHVSGGSGSYTFDWYRTPGGSHNGAVDSKTWLGSGNPYVFTIPDEGYGWWKVSVTVTDLVGGETESAETGFHVLPNPANRLDPDGNLPAVTPVFWVPRDSFPDNTVPELMVDQLDRSLRRIQAAFFDVYGKTFRMNPLEVIVSTKSEYELYGGDRAFPGYDGIVMGQAIDEAKAAVGCPGTGHACVPYTSQVLVLAWGAGGWAGAWGCDYAIAGVGEWGIASASGMQLPTLEPDAPWWLFAPDLLFWNIMFDPDAMTLAHELNNSIGWNDPYEPFLHTPHTPLEIAIGRDLPWLYETMNDTEDPNVSVVSPEDGTVVSGTITVSVDASDVDSGIDAVVLTIDGCWFGVSTTPPYTFSLDTTEVGHGSRRLTAIAYDRVGRVAQAETHVRVQNVLPSCPDHYPQDSGHVCYYDGIGFSGDYLGTLIDPPQILASDGSFGFLTRHDFGTQEVAFGKQEMISGLWRARVDFPENWYKFVVEASDGVRLYVNEEMILDEWQDQRAGFEPTVELSGYTDIRVEWYNNHGHALLEIFWQSVSPPKGEASEIRDWHDLHAVRDALGRHYVLVNDLDSTTPGYDELAGPTANEGKGWQPIGTETHPFFGTFDGQGCEIMDLFIDRPDEDRIGVFGLAYYGFIENIGAVDVTVTGNARVGALVGHNREGTVSNSYSSGAVAGVSQVGGLVGWNHSGGTVSNSRSSAGVVGNEDVGGLVGWNDWHSTVNRSFSTGSVIGGIGVGGLTGANHWSTIDNSYSTSSVGGERGVGGLLGYNHEGTVTDSYATGTLTRRSGGEQGFGGFVGWNYQGQIMNCYSTGSVHYQEPNPDPTDKGFAGLATEGGDYLMSGNFFDTETSGQTSTSGDATPKITEDMMNIDTFTAAGWSITAVATGETDDGYIWNIVDGQTYPFLSWQDPVGVPVAEIVGETREVNCDILPGVTVRAYLNGVEVDSAISDGDGNYVLEVAEFGDYQVVASRGGFIAESQAVSVTGPTTTVNFISGYGLIPEAPGTSHVLACISLWKTGDPPCHLTSSRVLAVISVWKNPILED